MNPIKLFICFFSVLGWIPPEHARRLKKEVNAEEVNEAFKEHLLVQLNSPVHLIFIVAEWGAGKTRQLFAFQKAEKKWFKGARYRSYFGVHKLEEAYARALPFGYRAIGFLLIAFASLKLGGFISRWIPEGNAGLKLSIQILSGALGLVLAYENKLKLLYLVTHGINWIPSFLVRRGKERVFILDDLDRSGLGAPDIWALLSNIWSYNHKYIVLLGYKDWKQRLDYEEMARKLEGKVVYLDVGDAKKLEICANRTDLFPVRLSQSGYEWVRILTLRELLAEIEYVLSNSPGLHPDMVRALLVYQFWHLLLTKLGFDDKRRLPCSIKSTDNQHFNFHDEKGKNESYEGNVMSSLIGSLEVNFRGRFFHNIIAEPRNGSSKSLAFFQLPSMTSARAFLEANDFLTS